MTPCDQGQKLFAEGLSTCHNDNERRAELSLLFSDLLNVVQGSELEAPLRVGYEDIHAQHRLEREREAGPNIEQALKAVVG